MGEYRTTATQKENVLIRAGDCSIVLLPEFGGKIASIQVKGRELLQAPLAAVATRSRTMSFDAADASGWDECLPSVAACVVETEAGRAEVSDHGDLWRVEWDVQGSGASGHGAATLRGRCFSLPLVLERSIELTETDKGWRLSLDYRLTNEGSTAVPWSWSAHPLFAVEAGDHIELPASVKSLRVEGSGGERLGRTGDRVGWPIAKLAHGGETDLRMVQGRESKIGDKLFAGPLRADENWCELRRPGAGVRMRIGFDAAATPYLGLWLCYGGWPSRPGAKQMCVAMEPCTAPVDSLAITGEWSRMLGRGESVAWPITVDLEIL